MLDKSEYHIIKNVTLPVENGTTQIDHIIVCVYGVLDCTPEVGQNMLE